MKRIDKSPTDKNLLESVSDDALGRNDDLAAFVGMLDEMEGGYSLCVDGPWGSGKTFFVKQVEMLLRHENDRLEGSYEELDGLVGKGCALGPKTRQDYLPVYFNAWDVDTFPDPLVALVGTMHAEYPKALAHGLVGSSADELLGRASGVIGLISPIVGLVNPLAGAAAKAVAGMVGSAGKAAEPSGVKSLIKSFDDRKNLESAMDKYVDALLENTGDRLVLFVDELDRCEPGFALRLLDEMKFVSRNDRVIVVYSTCLSQLEKAVENFYGEGFDAHRYLSRFFDLPPLHLARVNGRRYFCRCSHFDEDKNQLFIEQVSELIDVKSLSMRDVNRLISEFDESRGSIERNTSSDLCAFIECQLFPVMLAAHLSEDFDWHDMAGGGDFSLLWRYTEGLPRFSKDRESIAYSASGGTGVDRTNPDIIEKYLNALCACLVGDDREAASFERELSKYKMEYDSVGSNDRKLFSRFRY